MSISSVNALLIEVGKDGAALQHIYVDNGLTNAPVNFTLLSSVILGFSGIA